MLRYIFIVLILASCTTGEEEELIIKSERCIRYERNDYNSFDDTQNQCVFIYEDKVDVETYQLIGCKTSKGFQMWIDSVRCNNENYPYGITYTQGISEIGLNCNCD